MEQQSHKGLYIGIGIIIVLIGIGGIGYKAMHRNSSESSNQIIIPKVDTTMQEQPTVAPASSSGLLNKKDSSNTQLQKDQESVQSSMDQLQKDQTTSGQDTSNQALDVPQQ